MENEELIRDIIIENAIRLIAEGGFEKATTKMLAHSSETNPDFKMNEVYIYRLFGSKENVFEAAFLRLDLEIFNAFNNAVRKIDNGETKTKEDLYKLFLKAWNFVVGNEVRFRCYVRYYYSIYFKDNSLAVHSEHFEKIISVFKPFFKEEAEVGAIMHSVFTTLIDFAIRVYNGELSNDENNVPHIFNVLYCMMATYFKNAKNPFDGLILED